MTANTWGSDPAAPLRTLAQDLGLELRLFEAGEQLELLGVQAAISPERAARLQYDHLCQLAQAYGAALLCRVLHAERPILEVRPELTRQEVDEFQSALAGASSLSLDLRLDKSQLAQEWYADFLARCPFPQQTFLYLFPARLREFLQRATLRQLEQRLWKEQADQRVVIFLPGQDLLLAGCHLLLIGGERLASPPEMVFEKRARAAGEIQRVYQECQAALKWQKQWVRQLTPWHLYLDKALSEDQALLGALRRHFAQLFVLYSAERTLEQELEGGAARAISSYATAQETLDVPLSAGEPQAWSALPRHGFTTLRRIFEWIYDPRWKAADRLHIIQMALVGALKGYPAEGRLPALVENAGGIASNATWHWKAFIEDKIDLYLEQVQKLEERASRTAAAYADQISALIGKLTETMLAAVGVLIGSFIAALFKDTFNASIFRLGMLAYALYVLGFPLVYNMRGQWEAAQAIEEELETQKKWFLSRLPEARLRQIIDGSQVAKSRARFKRWYWWTVGLLAALVVLALLAAWLIPPVFQAA